jgi:hypothetical protein
VLRHAGLPPTSHGVTLSTPATIVWDTILSTSLPSHIYHAPAHTSLPLGHQLGPAMAGVFCQLRRSSAASFESELVIHAPHARADRSVVLHSMSSRGLIGMDPSCFDGTSVYAFDTPQGLHVAPRASEATHTSLTAPPSDMSVSLVHPQSSQPINVTLSFQHKSSDASTPTVPVAVVAPPPLRMLSSAASVASWTSGGSLVSSVRRRSSSIDSRRTSMSSVITAPAPAPPMRAEKHAAARNPASHAAVRPASKPTTAA